MKPCGWGHQDSGLSSPFIPKPYDSTISVTSTSSPTPTMNAITWKKVSRGRTPSASSMRSPPPVADERGVGVEAAGVVGSGVVTRTIVTRGDGLLALGPRCRARARLGPRAARVVAHHPAPHPQREGREDPPLHGVGRVAPPHPRLAERGGDGRQPGCRRRALRLQEPEGVVELTRPGVDELREVDRT